MITVDQFMNLKSRHQNGQSIGSIQQDTHHSKNTIRRVIRGEHPIETRTSPKPRANRKGKLDAFQDYIRKRVEEFDLSPEAKKVWGICRCSRCWKTFIV